MKVDIATIIASNGISGNVIRKPKPEDRFGSFPVDGESRVNGMAEQPKIFSEKLDKAIGVANEAFKDVNIAFKYYVDKKTNHEIVEIVNAETGEKIRQIPPEEIINMLSRMYDLLGLLVDTRV